MPELTADQKLQIISSEIYEIQNAQILLKEAFSFKEFDTNTNIYPYLMLIKLMEKHIDMITKLI